jgi:hypothetical protein
LRGEFIVGPLRLPPCSSGCEGTWPVAGQFSPAKAGQTQIDLKAAMNSDGGYAPLAMRIARLKVESLIVF